MNDPHDMRLAVTNVVICDALSQETLAFSATLLRDGQVIGHVSNDGQGGSHLFRFLNPSDRQWFDEYVSVWAATTGADFEPADQLISTLLQDHTTEPPANLTSPVSADASDLTHDEDVLLEYAELIRIAVQEHGVSAWSSDLAERPLEASQLRVLARRWREYHFDPPQFADRVEALADAVQELQGALASFLITETREHTIIAYSEQDARDRFWAGETSGTSARIVGLRIRVADDD